MTTCQLTVRSASDLFSAAQSTLVPTPVDPVAVESPDAAAVVAELAPATVVAVAAGVSSLPHAANRKVARSRTATGRQRVGIGTLYDTARGARSKRTSRSTPHPTDTAMRSAVSRSTSASNRYTSSPTCHSSVLVARRKVSGRISSPNSNSKSCGAPSIQ